MHPLGPCTPPRPCTTPGTMQPPGTMLPHPHPPVDRHTPVNILPCPKLRLRAVKSNVPCSTRRYNHWPYLEFCRSRSADSATLPREGAAPDVCALPPEGDTVRTGGARHVTREQVPVGQPLVLERDPRLHSLFLILLPEGCSCRFLLGGRSCRRESSYTEPSGCTHDCSTTITQVGFNVRYWLHCHFVFLGLKSF